MFKHKIKPSLSIIDKNLIYDILFKSAITVCDIIVLTVSFLSK